MKKIAIIGRHLTGFAQQLLQQYPNVEIVSGESLKERV